MQYVCGAINFLWRASQIHLATFNCLITFWSRGKLSFFSHTFFIFHFLLAHNFSFLIIFFRWTSNPRARTKNYFIPLLFHKFAFLTFFFINFPFTNLPSHILQFNCRNYFPTITELNSIIFHEDNFPLFFKLLFYTTITSRRVTSAKFVIQIP